MMVSHLVRIALLLPALPLQALNQLVLLVVLGCVAGSLRLFPLRRKGRFGQWQFVPRRLLLLDQELFQKLCCLPPVLIIQMERTTTCTAVCIPCGSSSTGTQVAVVILLR